MRFKSKKKFLTANEVKEIAIALVKIFTLFGVCLLVGYGVTTLLIANPQWLTFNFIYKYPNLLATSSLSAVWLFSQFVAYVIPAIVLIFFVWVIIRESYLFIKSKFK